MSNADVRIFGKTILTGEHAVLRGVPAIVLPVRQKYLRLRFFESENELKLTTVGATSSESEMAIWGVLEKALALCGHKRSDLQGELELKNDLPVGVGLGASAALCVAVGRLMRAQNWVEETDLFEFCRQLENLFHGESSGVDIAVALSGEPISFQREEGWQPLTLRWLPEFSISYCGQRGVTSECVQKVNTFIESEPDTGREIDARMRKASEMAIRALADDKTYGFLDLVESIQLARSCFEDWGLSEGVLKNHIDDVISKGALAAKPTGSGGGGHVLSLWPNPTSNPDFTRVLQ